MQELCGCAAGLAALLYSRATYDMIPENIIFTQALLCDLGLCKGDTKPPSKTNPMEC